MILCNTQQVKQAEDSAIALGYSSAQMIQTAGVELARFIRSRILHCSRLPVVVLCGRGNNGKDGQVVADTLSQWGFKVVTFKLLDNQPLLNNQKNNLIEDLKKSCVIVDALLGMGQTSDPKGAVCDVLQVVSDFKASESGNKLISISIDVPTGVNSDTGALYDTYFEADYTICVQWIKPGLLQFPARSVCGKIDTVDIGLKTECINRVYTINDAKTDLLALFNRPLNCHKGTFGKVYVFEGIDSTIGASILSASSALKVGAPLVYLVTKKSSQKFSYPVPEVMKCFIGESGKNKFASLLKNINSKDCLVIGPGFGLSLDRKKLFWELLKQLSKINAQPVLVLDADALTIIAQATKIEKQIWAKINKQKIILTPHPKEASLLLNCKTSDIEADRYKAALNIIEKFKAAAILLKGASTIVHVQENKQQSLTVHTNAKPSLATGGSGDVLTGIIAGLAAQIPFLNAINSAVFIHSQASVLFKSPVMHASCITQTIPAVLESVARN